MQRNSFFSRFIKSIFIFSLVALSSLSFAETLPSGYGKIKLGMGVDSVKDALKSVADFGYRGDRDVSLSPTSKEVIIETDATFLSQSFFNRCWFQFYEGNLYIITLNLNPSRIDYNSVFKTLCNKYGSPQLLNPDKSVWQDGSVIMSLEKPLALKYVDASQFQKLQDTSKVDKTQTEKSRENFLEGL